MRKTVITAIVAGVIGAVLAVPLVVYASHSFEDVPNTNTFHADIEWLKDSGVTKGCNPPANDEYCPKDNVTREQMAAFMRRLAENRVVDADTVDGRHASEFALESDIAVQGGSSCAGAGFYPELSAANYSGRDNRTTNNSGLWFGCPLFLPHGATITSLTASLTDATDTGSAHCDLRRMDVTGGRLGVGNGTAVILGSTDSTTGSSGANPTVSTSNISSPLVDARRYAYYITCDIGVDLGINGVVVRYNLG